MSEEISVEETAERSGVSRRTMLKGAAAVGGAIWVAPVIESFTNKAAAQSATTNYCLDGIISISWLALVVEDTNNNNNIYLAKIDVGNSSCSLTWGTNQTFPCTGSDWTGWPSNTQPGAPTETLISLVSCSADSITISLASYAVLIQEEEHGGVGNGPATCFSSSLNVSGPGNVTFYVSSTGTCP